MPTRHSTRGGRRRSILFRLANGLANAFPEAGLPLLGRLLYQGGTGTRGRYTAGIRERRAVRIVDVRPESQGIGKVGHLSAIG